MGNKFGTMPAASDSQAIFCTNKLPGIIFEKMSVRNASLANDCKDKLLGNHLWTMPSANDSQADLYTSKLPGTSLEKMPVINASPAGACTDFLDDVSRSKIPNF